MNRYPSRTFAPELPLAVQTAPEAVAPAEPMPVRVLVQEVPAPGQEAQLPETTLDDSRSLATARKSRRGGYLRMPVAALKALGRRAVLLDKFVRGTDLILRVRLMPAHAHAHAH